MPLPTRKSLVWIAPLFLILLAANLVVFLGRDWEATFYPSNYATLNYPLDRPTLRRWKTMQGDRLQPDIAWNRVPQEWELLVDGKTSKTMPGDDPEITLAAPPLLELTGTSKDFHEYTLRPLPEGTGIDLNFSIEGVSAELYRRAGQSAAHDIYVVHTDVPIGDYVRHPVSFWSDDYSYVDAKSLAEADRIVREDMGVRDADDTQTRMDKVFRYLKSVGIASNGVPRDDYRWMDPYAIFKEMRAGTGHGWCTQNAQIFVFFANRAGIPTRFVFGCNCQDNTVYYTGHSWAECYVKEKGRWTYVDVTMSIIGVYGRDGNPINTADIYQMCQHDTFDGITANIFKDWDWQKLAVESPPKTAVSVPFSLVNKMAKEEYNTLAILKYRIPPNVEDVRDDYTMLLKDRTFAWTNFKRYFFEPPLAYSNLQTDGARTLCKRQILFFAAAASFLLLVIALFRKSNRASGEQ